MVPFCSSKDLANGCTTLTGWQVPPPYPQNATPSSSISFIFLARIAVRGSSACVPTFMYRIRAPGLRMDDISATPASSPEKTRHHGACRTPIFPSHERTLPLEQRRGHRNFLIVQRL